MARQHGTKLVTCIWTSSLSPAHSTLVVVWLYSTPGMHERRVSHCRGFGSLRITAAATTATHSHTATQPHSHTATHTHTHSTAHPQGGFVAPEPGPRHARRCECRLLRVQLGKGAQAPGQCNPADGYSLSVDGFIASSGMCDEHVG